MEITFCYKSFSSSSDQNEPHLFIWDGTELLRKQHIILICKHSWHFKSWTFAETRHPVNHMWMQMWVTGKKWTLVTKWSINFPDSSTAQMMLTTVSQEAYARWQKMPWRISSTLDFEVLITITMPKTSGLCNFRNDCTLPPIIILEPINKKSCKNKLFKLFQGIEFLKHLKILCLPNVLSKLSKICTTLF